MFYFMLLNPIIIRMTSILTVSIKAIDFLPITVVGACWQRLALGQKHNEEECRSSGNSVPSGEALTEVKYSSGCLD
jgi:hypothetical protein